MASDMTESAKDILHRISDSHGDVNARELAKLLAELKHTADCAYAEHIRQGNY